MTSLGDEVSLVGSTISYARLGPEPWTRWLSAPSLPNVCTTPEHRRHAQSRQATTEVNRRFTFPSIGFERDTHRADVPNRARQGVLIAPELVHLAAALRQSASLRLWPAATVAAITV